MSDAPNEVRQRGVWGEKQLAASPRSGSLWCRFCGRGTSSTMLCAHCGHELQREVECHLPASARYLAKTAQAAEAALQRLLSLNS